MQRRRFLKVAALGVTGLCGSARATAASRNRSIMTVRGPIDPGRLGRTLMHEHVMVDFIGADKIAPGRYDGEEVFRTALPHLQRLQSLGCDTLVECTPNRIGRDPAILQRLSAATGLNILTNTGLYGAARDKYIPRFAYQETADQLAERWVREFEDGIPPSGVRPGFMKIGVDAGPLSEIDAKLVHAAARAHKRTGLVIASHTGDGKAALAQLDVLKAEGVDPSAFIWVHAQNESDPDVHRYAAEVGAWVEFDGIGPDSIDRHVDLVMRVIRAGHLGRLLVSQDAGWYHVGEPGGGNYRDYDTLFREFLPALRKAGSGEGEMQTLIIGNPRAALTPQS